MLKFNQVKDLMELHTMIEERAPTWAERMMQQGVLQGMQQGMQQGEQQGLQKGEVRGKVQSLKRLLTRKFGPIPATIETKINTATPEQLDTWFDAAIDATHIDSVFASH
jgi:flagellar biosynthesis/type III secretory pathway protein FliH